ncbi:hypothetical protein K435DRAFT_780416 [Dendrothele bispora CBS 962.96]|uniref:Uncharacterized protein n=1 Tax=Dendrothele bispora (strain CBS 962.96) TaxID=1314807 RepID=A0A4S8LS16_DENBC|nr:hypothetical protein K435DRAFT_780416 [Dendrothele bispora CBS 962.96]
MPILLQIVVSRFSKCFPLRVICYAKPSLVSFVDAFIHSAALLTPELGSRFFVASTSLTRVGPISKKGRWKGKGEKYKEKPKAQSRPDCPVGSQTGLDRYQIQFSRY